MLDVIVAVFFIQAAIDAKQIGEITRLIGFCNELTVAIVALMQILMFGTVVSIVAIVVIVSIFFIGVTIVIVASIIVVIVIVQWQLPLLLPSGLFGLFALE